MFFYYWRVPKTKEKTMEAIITVKTAHQTLCVHPKPTCKCGSIVSVIDLSAQTYRRECYKCGEIIAMEITPRRIRNESAGH
jgi:hypothetical protein